MTRAGSGIFLYNVWMALLVAGIGAGVVHFLGWGPVWTAGAGCFFFVAGTKPFALFMTRVWMSLVYFLIIGPTRLVLLVLGRDFLDRTDDQRTTNWRPLAVKEKRVEDYYHLS